MRLLPLLAAAWATSAQAIDCHVSPTGDDANPGTQARPLRTLAQARDAVRKTNADMVEDIVVHLAAGDYLLGEPVIFTDRDSGTNGHRVIYRSSDGIGAARLVGGKRLTGWTRDKGEVWKVEVGDRVFHTLYEGGQRARKARHPNYAYNPDFPAARAPYFTSEAGAMEGEPTPGESWLVIREDDFDPAWTDVGQMKINVFPWGTCDWHQWICQVKSLDAKTRKLVFDNLGDRTEINWGARYFLEDHPAFLDAPGEFYLEKSEGVLYYWPRGDRHPDESDIVMPVAKDLIRLEGASRTTPVHDLAFEGLALEYTDGLSPTLHWWTHGWGRTDHALVWMRNVHDVALRNCHLSNGGRNGILMVGENQRNRVEGCWIEQMGVNGIALANRFVSPDGPGPTPDRCEHNVLTNNRIHDVGQLSLYAACVALHNVSHNELSHSEFFNSPRYATTMRGNTNGQDGEPAVHPRFPPATGNVLHHLMIYDCGQDSGDMGALQAAGVNIPGGDCLNTYEQITIDNTRAVPGMNDIGPDGIFLDWPRRAMHQVFRNVHTENSQDLPLRGNGAENSESAQTENVSWKPDFDEAGMDYESIGLRADFPEEFGGRGVTHAVPEAPSVLTAEAVAYSSIKLTWQPPPGDFGGRLVYSVLRDGTPIGTTKETTLVDRGLREQTEHRYRVLARNSAVGRKSPWTEEVSATTLADRVPPKMMLVANRKLTEIIVRFSERVDRATAEEVGNYRVHPDHNVHTARLTDDDTAVVLTVDALSPTATYTVSVANVRDRSAAANPLEAGARATFRVAQLLLHYPLHASQGLRVEDVSGNELHGELQGGAKWSAEHDALELNGEDAWVRGPIDLYLGQRDFTLMAWIRKTKPGNRVILAKGNGWSHPTEWSWGWEYPDHSHSIAFRTNNQFHSTAPDSIPVGTWLHLAFVRDGDRGLSYVNGEPSGSPHDLSAVGDLNNGKPLMIGRREYNKSPAWFAGQIADVRVYGRALSEQDIRAITDPASARSRR